jgi:hypothetical protein
LVAHGQEWSGYVGPPSGRQRRPLSRTAEVDRADAFVHDVQRAQDPEPEQVAGPYRFEPEADTASQSLEGQAAERSPQHGFGWH